MIDILKTLNFWKGWKEWFYKMCKKRYNQLYSVQMSKNVSLHLMYKNHLCVIEFKSYHVFANLLRQL